MIVEKKIEEMGFVLPKAPKPGGVYVPSRRIGNLIYISGQIPTLGGEHQVVGVLGKDLEIEDGKKAAQICALSDQAGHRNQRNSWRCCGGDPGGGGSPLETVRWAVREREAAGRNLYASLFAAGCDLGGSFFLGGSKFSAYLH